ncbi:MAG: hypothetical protein H0V29_04345 [Thermoleophilaceae bacterium]|nr:hypothetical protein [Thermoleophilaceae bacterium]
MGKNGKQTPPRPRIELQGGTASPEEAAAIAAAIEQFIRDTAPPPVAEQRINPWVRASLYENASIMATSGALDPDNANTWGDGEPWGR